MDLLLEKECSLIGKSCCLIHEKVGPRLRLVTILTDAPLEPDHPVANKCGKCTACKDACIPGAIKGVLFDPEQGIGQRFNPKLCEDYFDEMKERHGIGHCGKCLAVCPWGKR
ncbi:4Fe-4S double cluster binding domain-containing protein [Geosporobacter ferrireducens]|uniref:4Fe-4S double cluster binding domain-containing protein n=1 Tax=Geosporobacter ferrireducens TaxID=1424294 RepID=UPI0009F5043F|nr:4Fe-4S double cluster binding domain-containing protein [Geosporobacter ferrireducens]